jgi:chemotaxis signal transduction protein
VADQDQLQQLQKECLQEGKALVEETHTILANFICAPYQKLEELRAVVNTLSGNLNALGFAEFARWVQEAERVLSQASRLVDGAERVLSQASRLVDGCDEDKLATMEIEQLELHLLHWMLDVELCFVESESGDSAARFKQNSLVDIDYWCEQNGGVPVSSSSNNDTIEEVGPVGGESEGASVNGAKNRQDMVNQIIDDAEAGWIPGCQSVEQGGSATPAPKEEISETEDNQVLKQETVNEVLNELNSLELSDDEPAPVFEPESTPEPEPEPAPIPAPEPAPEIITASLTGEIAPIMDQLTGIISDIKSDPLDSFSLIRESVKITQEKLGQFDAPHFAQLLNSFDRSIEKLQEKLSSLSSGQLNQIEVQEDLGVLEFFLTEVISDFNSYLLTIDLESEDSFELMQSKAGSLVFVEDWELSQPPAPVSSSPSPSQPKEVIASEGSSPGNSSDGQASSSDEKGDNSQGESRGWSENSLAKYLICRNGGSQLAISISYVLEIIPSEQLSPLPYKHPKIKGLYNLRGEPLPIMLLGEVEAMKQQESSVEEDKPDLESELDGPAIRRRRKKGQRYIIVAESGEDEPFGFEVDEVNQVEELDSTTFQPIEDLSQNVKQRSICSHLMLKEQETVLIIDGTRIMQQCDNC